MIRHPMIAVAAAALIAFSVGCDSEATRTPAAPSTTPATTEPATLDAFNGTWTSVAGAVSGASGLPNGCSQLDYKVTPVPGTQSAAVDFAATCANVSVQGTGTASLSGATLMWGAKGTVAVGTSPVCPFTFSNSTATREAGGIRITYSGTVCGVPVSGSELLQKRS